MIPVRVRKRLWMKATATAMRGLHSEDSVLSSDTEDRNPTQGPLSSGSPPSTPQRLLSPPRSAPWSSRSAPALLEILTDDPSNTPDSSREKENSISLQEVDDKIVEVLRKPLLKMQLNRNKAGNNYLFEAIPPGDPQMTVVNIGHTARTEQRRLKEIGTQCGHFSIKQEEDPEGSPIILYKKAELLMQAELYNCKYQFACSCRRAHREYFSVDKATAQEMIQRWRAFCKSDPYDADGNLLPFWDYRLRRHKHLDNDFHSLQVLSEEEGLRMRWKRFSNPTKLEKLYFDVAFLNGREESRIEWLLRIHTWSTTLALTR